MSEVGFRRLSRFYATHFLKGRAGDYGSPTLRTTLSKNGCVRILSQMGVFRKTSVGSLREQIEHAYRILPAASQSVNPAGMRVLENWTLDERCGLFDALNGLGQLAFGLAGERQVHLRGSEGRIDLGCLPRLPDGFVEPAR